MIRTEQHLQDWKSTGSYLNFGKQQHKVFIKEMGRPKASPNKTLLLFHGFPESSYSYEQIIDGMLEIFDRIILFDFIGFGWSDKADTFSYSLMEQADVALAVWKHFEVTGGHLIAHDMGNSIATEILARHNEHQLPDWFSNGLKSVTFTNGSIVLHLAKLRISQKILLSNQGWILSKFLNFKIFKHQIKSAHGNQNLSEEVILKLWQGNLHQNGHHKSHLTIRYIKDRIEYEQKRWLPALTKTDIPIHLCWGTDDQVAKIEMAYYLKEKICPKANLSIMENVGHFCQLGNSLQWITSIGQYYKKVFPNI